jgi:hypothetical protein
MARHDGKQSRSGQQQILVGLLLVALFLGHDALMATQARAAPHHVSAGMHDAAGSEAFQGDGPAPLGQTPEPAHPANCGIGQRAVLRGSDTTDAADAQEPAITGLLLTGTPPLGTAGSFAWKEPHWPTGALRALFQVYRI